MKSKKIMQITDCYLNLPDNFEGSLLDALKLLVQYREEAESKHNVNKHSKKENGFDLLWNNDNVKCLISYGFAELNNDGTDWIYDAGWIDNTINKSI